LHVAADEAGFDREFAVAAVDEHQQVDPGGTPVIEERVQRGANRASRPRLRARA
jgi:hypothetical protein